MAGALLVSIPHEFTALPALSWMAIGCTLAGLACFAPQVPRKAAIFLAIGAALLVAAVAILPEWPEALAAAFVRGAFIAAFFTALTAIRSAAITDPGILECGRFLAGQPPGRRYVALTLGGQAFGLVLMYGSISLLGALATENAETTDDPEVQRHRTRRMLVAIQRGFISTLPWSPLAFASAISLSVVPGSAWAAAVPFCLVSSALLAGIGWTLDTVFKPRLSHPAPQHGPAEGQWLRHLRPLLTLLAVLLGSAATLHLVTGVRIFGAVMAIVPILSLAWVALQPGTRGGARGTAALSRAGQFATADLPALKTEITLLVMAGVIGSLGSALAAPLAGHIGFDLTALPAWVVLLSVFWLIPFTGQIGMNPILAVSLFGPLLPAPEALGIAPAVMVCAITSGWALSGATSPFTASVLLVANFGRVSALHAGLRWNGVYALTCGVVLSGWILLLARLL
ncbi:hypothetical protein SAMN04488020_103100 [Palleronia marisminoris]|uniref:H+/citrate symporter n=2 Tax=Palleronia marisminoris TaxID=315423 RepID=A0A1Y5S6L8_9RHOB|nr:hypothetical protein SAMN04488020_103100 [Palleronia marisminoris]SLN33657.1 hypothetical protein PAM7066_01380 [Palleronia marisminoris]